MFNFERDPPLDRIKRERRIRESRKPSTKVGSRYGCITYSRKTARLLVSDARFCPRRLLNKYNVENDNSTIHVLKRTNRIVVVFFKKKKRKEKERNSSILLNIPACHRGYYRFTGNRDISPRRRKYTRLTSTRDGMQMLLPFFVRLETAESGGAVDRNLNNLDTQRGGCMYTVTESRPFALLLSRR